MILYIEKLVDRLPVASSWIRLPGLYYDWCALSDMHIGTFPRGLLMKIVPKKSYVFSYQNIHISYNFTLELTQWKDYLI